MSYTTVEEIIQANLRAGERWFSPSNWRGLRQRASLTVYDGHFFIVSKQETGIHSGMLYRRLYDVFVCHDDGTVVRLARDLSRYKAHLFAQSQTYTAPEVSPSVTLPFANFLEDIENMQDRSHLRYAMYPDDGMFVIMTHDGHDLLRGSLRDAFEYIMDRLGIQEE